MLGIGDHDFVLALGLIIADEDLLHEVKILFGDSLPPGFDAKVFDAHLLKNKTKGKQFVQLILRLDDVRSGISVTHPNPHHISACDSHGCVCVFAFVWYDVRERWGRCLRKKAVR